ncbi:hypothetical protein FF098_017350 [Parvularcula flava]|uniref:Uncharacterized protein n=1 Tax=Aquisalinus luteolus TaxID=1566827 RepID=A0A8J3EQH0_9PROT|nr:hypothetical protein [Aquisalinus luteolus]NHK29676.1 hypothetical protein [Aquisalinus luteolus]GGI02138.1 hypothetical protein GCM10011355_34430 [Aquisalinus luteolus]
MPKHAPNKPLPPPANDNFSDLNIVCDVTQDLPITLSELQILETYFSGDIATLIKNAANDNSGDN